MGFVLCATILVGVVMVLGGAVGVTTVARAATASAPYFSLSLTPSQSLTTDELLTVKVTREPAGTAAGLEIRGVATGWCTSGFQAPSTFANHTTSGPRSKLDVDGTSFGPLPTTFARGPGRNCTTKTHPLNADVLPATQISPPLNSTGNYPTVSGQVIAQATGGTALADGTILTCDATSPCQFVVAVYTWQNGQNGPTVMIGVPVTYAATGAGTVCGGAATGQLTTVAPDRLGQTLTDWTLDACAAGTGGGKALTSVLASSQGDASSLAAFADGSADLAYSAVGYGATRSFTPSVDRPYVAVPIAINAVVLGHVETHNITNPASLAHVFGDYPQLDITDAQAAQLLGGGPTSTDLEWKSSLGQALVSENPTLGGAEQTYYGSTQQITFQAGGKTSTVVNGVVATSLADATSFFATSFFHTVAPKAMVSNRTTKPLGVTADLGTATPPFNVVPATGLDIMSKDLTPGDGQGFALTNAATAATLWGGLADFALQTPGSIGSSNPTFVTPTPQSMQAAVSEMIPQADGTLLPNSDATEVDGVQPYPLTYVEYAIAPTEPLLTTSCAPRSASEQDLLSWLDYITGPGQSELPAGLVPLTASLQAQAQSAIAQVGTATPTGGCAPGGSGDATSGTGAPPEGQSANAGSPGGSGAAGGPGTTASAFGTPDLGESTSGSAANPGATSNPGAKGKGSQQVVGADLAGFTRVEGLGWLLPVLGVLLLVLLLPGLALLLAGRSPRQALAGLAGVVRQGNRPPGGAP